MINIEQRPIILKSLSLIPYLGEATNAVWQLSSSKAAGHGGMKLTRMLATLMSKIWSVETVPKNFAIPTFDISTTEKVGPNRASYDYHRGTSLLATADKLLVVPTGDFVNALQRNSRDLYLNKAVRCAWIWPAWEKLGRQTKLRDNEVSGVF